MNWSDILNKGHELILKDKKGKRTDYEWMKILDAGWKLIKGDR